MRRVVLISIIIMLVIACGPTVQNPAGTPSPAPTPDLSGRFVEVPPNQPFKYTVVAAGIVRLNNQLVITQGLVGPSFNLRMIGTVSVGKFVITYDGYAPPDDNSNIIVKAVAQGANGNRGPYAVSFVGFRPQGIELSLWDLKAGAPPTFEPVDVMVEVSRYSRTS